MTLLEEVKELDRLLERDEYKPWCYQRLTVAKIIKLLETEQLQQAGISGKLAYYQLCPKCFGEAQVENIGTSSSLYRICPVCNGTKTLRVETFPPACANGAVDTVAEARAVIKKCKELENCGCGDECKLTIEDVRKSSDAQP